MPFPCKMYEITAYKVILGRIKWLVLQNLYAPAEKTPRHFLSDRAFFVKDILMLIVSKRIFL